MVYLTGISGESSVDDLTIDPEQQKVNYFELKSSMDTAIQLQPLVRGSSSAMSILTGVLCMYMYMYEAMS